MNKNKSGFTLSEMLIALAILGILGVVLTPVITKLMPNQNKVMIKRTYYQITNTVAKMLEDETLYSPFGAAGTEDETTPIYAESRFSDTSAVNFNGNNYSGDTKFEGIFSEMIGAKSSGTAEITPVFRRGPGSRVFVKATLPIYKSKDGVNWMFYNPEYTDVVSIILVDVNGDKAPNCFQSEYSSCPSRTKDFDQYFVAVYNSGKIALSFNDEWVSNILNASTSSNME